MLAIWWCPCVESSLVLLEEGGLLWPVLSLGKTPLAFGLLYFVPQGQICLLLQVFLDFLLSWLPTTEPCVPGPRRKGQWSHRRLACGCLGVSAKGMGWQWPAAGLGAGTVAVHAWDLLKEVIVIFITSTIVWSQVNSREGTQLHQSTESWIKDLGSMALPIRTRPSIPLSQSILSGSCHKPLILLHLRADWKSQSQKTNQSNHMDHSLV